MKNNTILDKKLATVKFRVDGGRHINVAKDKCTTCGSKICTICPGGCYMADEKTEKLFTNFEGCLECGTCRKICPLNSIDWSYPRGGYGVAYKLG